MVCCKNNKNIKTAWYSWKWMLRGLTGGLWTGRRRGKTPIIENTTVHSHSSTAGAIHSQQTHHHYGSGGLCLQQRGSANFYLGTRRTCGYFTWPCPHPISTDTHKKKTTTNNPTEEEMQVFNGIIIIIIIRWRSNDNSLVSGSNFRPLPLNLA